MPTEQTLVWLPRAADPPDRVAAQQADLAGRAVLTIPSAELVDDRLDLGLAVAAVREELDSAGYREGALPVFGAGLGALVALRLAADRPDRVSWVAVTAGSAEAPTVRSVWAAASRLLPGSALPATGRRRSDVLAALDQVRAVDYHAYVARVHRPSRVVCGVDDRAGLASARALVRRLPRGELQLVPGAGPGWLTEHPRWLGEVVGRMLDEGF